MLLNCGVGEDSWRVPWTARRSNQAILKEISPVCSLKGLMLNLKLQHFGHLMERIHSFEKTLMLGKIVGRRRRGWQRIRWLDGITDSMDMGFGKLRELVLGRKAWRAAAHGVTKSQTRLSNWTELNWELSFHFPSKAKYIFFSSAHGVFSRMDHMLGHKTSLNKFTKTIVLIKLLFQPQWYETRNQPKEKKL